MKNKSLYLIVCFLSIPFQTWTTELKWAADAEGNAPYIFQNPNNPTKLIGFEVDLMEELCKVLNMDSRFIQNQWDGLIPGLYRGDYQVAANGIEITEDREKEVLFSIPYYITNLTIVIDRKNSNIHTFDDLKGKNVGALKNSFAERVLLEAENINTITYEGEVNAFEDLKNGRIIAVLADAPIVLYYTALHNNLKLINEKIGKVSYGIAIKKFDSNLKNKIDSGLKILMDNGRLKSILMEWKLWNFQMAEFTNDLSTNLSEPVKFNNYIQSQINEITFEERMVRYLSFFPLIVQAAIVTMEISLLSMMIAIIFGMFLALIRIYAPAPFSNLSVIYIEIVRGTPLLIQLFFIFYALPSIGISLSPFLAAIFGLGLNYGAYEAENYRAGLNSVPKGQMEASLALGLNRRQSLRFIVIPQAVRLVIPPVTNDFISLLKDSSLVSVITLVELTKLYSQLSNAYFDYIGTGIIIALVYLILGLPFVNLSKYFERKLRVENIKSKF